MGTTPDAFTTRLASVSGSNDVRDFWSAVDIPVAPELIQFINVLKLVHATNWFCLIWSAEIFRSLKVTDSQKGFHGSVEEIETINVPVQHPKSPQKLTMKSYPIVHPHRVLAYLFDHVQVQVPDSDVQFFWNHARAMMEPWATNSPATSSHIPLGLHGDSARLWTQYKVEKVVAIWMNIVLFRPSSVRHSRFLLFTCPSAVMVKNRTLNRVWRRLAWSFNSAFEGINPVIGESNRPLIGGDLARAGTPLTSTCRKFALVELRGDWEWHRDVWRTTATWKAVKTCFQCPAVSKGPSEYLYHNIGDDCQWVHEEFDLDQFIARRLKDRHLCTQKNIWHHCSFFLWICFDFWMSS